MCNSKFLKSIFSLFVTFISINLQIQCLHQNAKNHNFVQKSIVAPSHGFSTDKQQISPLACYNIKTLPATQSKSIVNLNQGLSYKDLTSSFHLQASANIPFLFSGSISANYLSSIQDTDFSFSVSYYQHIEANVDVQFGYGPEAALTKDGFLAYKDGKNPQFGLICGDKVFDSYKVGAMLVMSINFQFNNHEDKNTFTSGLGATFQSFASISLKVEKISDSQNIKGSASVKAFQIGGNPSELGQILNSKCGDHYCTSSCDIQNMKNCSFAVDGLINYAMKNMSNQVSVQNNKGLTSLPIQFANLIQIKWLGLNQPLSYVTSQTEKARQSLIIAYAENKYYVQKFHVLLDKYPVPWDIKSNIYKFAKFLYNQVNNNIRLLNDPDQGALICYSDPQNCVQKAQQLLLKLKFVKLKELQFLKQIQYRYSLAKSIYFYKYGDTRNSWNFTQDYEFCNITKKSKPFLKSDQNLSYSKFQYVCSNYSYFGFCKAIVSQNQFQANSTKCNITSYQFCRQFLQIKQKIFKKINVNIRINQKSSLGNWKIHKSFKNQCTCKNGNPVIFVQGKPNHQRLRLKNTQINTYLHQLQSQENRQLLSILDQTKKDLFFTVSQYYFQSYTKNQTDEKPNKSARNNQMSRNKNKMTQDQHFELILATAQLKQQVSQLQNSMKQTKKKVYDLQKKT